MKIFVQFREHESPRELKGSVSRAAWVMGHDLTENEEEAELIITDDPGNALRLFKENEEAVIAIVELPAEQRNLGEAINALAKRYPGRVETFHLNGDNLLQYLKAKREGGTDANPGG